MVDAVRKFAADRGQTPAQLCVVVPRDAVAGTRYPAPMMAHFDSEH